MGFLRNIYFSQYYELRKKGKEEKQQKTKNTFFLRFAFVSEDAGHPKFEAEPGSFVRYNFEQRSAEGNRCSQPTPNSGGVV